MADGFYTMQGGDPPRIEYAKKMVFLSAGLEVSSVIVLFILRAISISKRDHEGSVWFVLILDLLFCLCWPLVGYLGIRQKSAMLMLVYCGCAWFLVVGFAVGLISAITHYFSDSDRGANNMFLDDNANDPVFWGSFAVVTISIIANLLAGSYGSICYSYYNKSSRVYMGNTPVANVNPAFAQAGVWAGQNGQQVIAPGTVVCPPGHTLVNDPNSNAPLLDNSQNQYGSTETNQIQLQYPETVTVTEGLSSSSPDSEKIHHIDDNTAKADILHENGDVKEIPGVVEIQRPR